MDELLQASSLPSSLQKLLEELEHLIAFEAQKNGNPWLSIDRVTELFNAKYGISPEHLAIAQGYGSGLRSANSNLKCITQEVALEGLMGIV